jgi:hypothetical protein
MIVNENEGVGRRVPRALVTMHPYDDNYFFVVFGFA